MTALDVVTLEDALSGLLVESKAWPQFDPGNGQYFLHALQRIRAQYSSPALEELIEYQELGLKTKSPHFTQIGYGAVYTLYRQFGLGSFL